MLTTQSAHRKDMTAATADMQHRHFATIAAIIRYLPVEDRKMRDAVARHFAHHLHDTNPRFNESRFLAACGVSE